MTSVTLNGHAVPAASLVAGRLRMIAAAFAKWSERNSKPEAVSGLAPAQMQDIGLTPVTEAPAAVRAVWAA